MGSFKNTDNLGTTLQVGDHVGYVYGSKDHYRIHSGIVMELLDKRVWIKPDEVFENDARYPKSIVDSEDFSIMHPNHKYSEKDNWYMAPYGRVVKLGY